MTLNFEMTSIAMWNLSLTHFPTKTPSDNSHTDIQN